MIAALRAQIGRGGRDGEHTDCWMFTKSSNFTHWEAPQFLPADKNGSGGVRASYFDDLDAMRVFAFNVQQCRWVQLINHLGGGSVDAQQQVATAPTCLSPQSPRNLVLPPS